MGSSVSVNKYPLHSSTYVQTLFKGFLLSETDFGRLSIPQAPTTTEKALKNEVEGTYQVHQVSDGIKWQAETYGCHFGNNLHKTSQ
jgi:hypothetical protein